MIPYLKLLIRQRIAAWNPVNHVTARRAKWKVVLSYIGFGLVMLMLYAMLVVMEYFLYDAFASLGEAETMLALTGAMCTILTLITSFFYIFSELFFSKDVQFVSSLPISSRGLLTAKLIRIWLGEAGIALAVCLPAVILYGIGQGSGVLYYLKALVLIPFMPMAPIAVVTLLSFLLIRVSALWKRREALTVVMGMLFLAGIMWFQFSFSSNKGEMQALMLQMVLRQRRLLDTVAGLYPPIRWFTTALTAQPLQSLVAWLSFAALNVAACALVVALLGGAYQRLAVKQGEALTRLNASAKRRVDRHGLRAPLIALYRREIREIFQVPVYAMNCLTASIMFPVIALVILLQSGDAASEFAMLPAFLLLVPKALVVAGATALFAFTTCMNMAVSTSVSREGKRHEFFRTLPVAPETQLQAKLMMGLTLNLLSSVPVAVLLFMLMPAFRTQLVIGFLASLLFSTATAITGLMIDTNHPKFGWKNETEAIKQNGMATLAMFGSMGAIVLCAAAYVGLTMLKVSLTGSLWIVCGIALVADILLYRRLVRHTSKRYLLQEVRL